LTGRVDLFYREGWLFGTEYTVYYEAGYAQALDKEVSVTWKKTDESKEQPHFYVAQKNMIRWEDEEELYRSLVKRIEATVENLFDYDYEISA